MSQFFRGTGPAPTTQSLGDNSTSAATDAFVQAAINYTNNPTSFLGWSIDEAALGSACAICVSGRAYAVRVPIWTTAVSATRNVTLVVATHGTTLTSAENGFACYSASGTQLGTSADQSTSWATTGSYTSACGTWATTAGSSIWVVVWSNGTTPITLAGFNANVGTALNAGLSAATLRFAVPTASGVTTAPAALTPSGFGSASSPQFFWAAIS